MNKKSTITDYFNVGNSILSRLDGVKAFDVGFSIERPDVLPLHFKGMLYKLKITAVEEGELSFEKIKQIIENHEQEELIYEKVESIVKDIKDALSKKSNFGIFLKVENGSYGKEIEISKEEYLELLLKSISEDLEKYKVK